MSELRLDPTKLLGFKIIATSESIGTLRSAKIGGKLCVPNIGRTSSANAAALRAKVGTKTD
ncbi:MAG TPA: hypothetical protein VGJ75_07215 [Dongiaceae bacterium]|jgi:hypothetical protein